jgi:hypothetical protein
MESSIDTVLFQGPHSASHMKELPTSCYSPSLPLWLMVVCRWFKIVIGEAVEFTQTVHFPHGCTIQIFLFSLAKVNGELYLRWSATLFIAFHFLISFTGTFLPISCK